MTPDTPSESRLLQTVRVMLKDDILPALPDDERLNLLMALSALSMVERRLEDSSDALDARQRERLQCLSGEVPDAAALAARVRAGCWQTPGETHHLWRILWADTKDRLARTNPKYLAQLESEGMDEY